MSFESYSALQAEIGSWLRRADLSASIPGFIALAEAQMNRRLRTADMVTRANGFPIEDEFSTFPDYFAGVKTFDIAGSPPIHLKYLEPDAMTRLKAETSWSSGTPRYFTVVGPEFQYYPAPASQMTAELTYYRTIPALTADNDTNWLLQKHPDAYLYGALAQSAPFLRADERLPMWVSAFGQILDDINEDEKRKASSGMGAALEVLPAVYGAGNI